LKQAYDYWQNQPDLNCKLSGFCVCFVFLHNTQETTKGFAALGYGFFV